MSDPDDPRAWDRARLLAHLYDWEHDHYTADVDLYLALAKRTGGPVLELACGTGRVLRPLVERGYEVTGVDHSEAMLARARSRIGGSGRATLVRADMVGGIPDGRFGLIVIALNGLGFACRTEDQVRLLHSCKAALVAGGLVALDLVHGPAVMDQPQGVAIMQRSAPDAGLQAMITKWIVREIHPATEEIELSSHYDLTWPSGELTRVSETVRMRYFGRHEIDLLLQAAELDLEGVYGDYALGAFEDHSERMIVLAH